MLICLAVLLGGRLVLLGPLQGLPVAHALLHWPHSGEYSVRAQCLVWYPFLSSNVQVGVVVVARLGKMIRYSALGFRVNE